MRRYVVGFYFTPDDRVLLIEKRRPAWQAGKLNGIGGKIEAGETPARAMQREFAEEAGINVPPESWDYFAVLEGSEVDGEQYEVFFFRVNATYSDRAVARTDEGLRTAHVARLPAEVVPNLHWLVPMAALRCRHDWPFVINERAGKERAHR